MVLSISTARMKVLPVQLSNTSCSNVTGYSEINLVLCVEDSLVLYLVCASFWILSIFKLLTAVSSQLPIPFNRFNAAKLVSVVY